MVRTLVFETSNPGSIPGNANTSIPERSKGLVSSSSADASWVQIPLLVLGSTENIPYSLDGQDTPLSPERPGFESRCGKQFDNTNQNCPEQDVGDIKGSHRQDVQWEHVKTLSTYSNSSKTLRLQIFRRSASQVRILPRVYALVCKRSKQVCYNVDS